VGLSEQDQSNDFNAHACGDESGALRERSQHDEGGDNNQPAGEEQQASNQLQ